MLPREFLKYSVPQNAFLDIFSQNLSKTSAFLVLGGSLATSATRWYAPASLTSLGIPGSFPFVTHVVCMKVSQNENLRAVFCKIFNESLERALILTLQYALNVLEMGRA